MNGTTSRASGFQSTRPVRGATTETYTVDDGTVFQSTRPVWGATLGEVVLPRESRVSIHAPLCLYAYVLVSIHAPRAGRDVFQSDAPQSTIVSIHAPRVGRDYRMILVVYVVKVSIHAPRVGRDGVALLACPRYAEVSIHAPRAGRDPRRERRGVRRVWFQSTRPVRGATRRTAHNRVRIVRFNPRAPCGARPVTSAYFIVRMGFNPRAPCGARLCGRRHSEWADGFNPRAPCGARPFFLLILHLMGAFQSMRPMRGATRPPRLPSARRKFQSTRPMRGATMPLRPMRNGFVVSIHAPRVGRDSPGRPV